MKVHPKKIEKSLFRYTAKSSTQKADLTDLCMVIFLGLLPFATTRLSLGSMSMSITSCTAIILCSIFLFTASKHVGEVFLKHRAVHFFVCVAIITAFVVALATGTVRGWGIFMEWFLLPISVGLVILHRTSIQPQSIRFLTEGLLVALAGVVLSSFVFATHSIFTYDGRLHALWPSANHLALFSAPLLVYTTILLVGCKNLRDKLLLGMLVALGLYALYLTKSFGGLAAFTIASVIAYWMHSSISRRKPKQKKRYIVALCILVSIIFGSVALEKFAVMSENAERSSLASRLTIYQVSVDMLRHAPLTGIGLGNFQQEYLSLQPYYPPYLEWAVPLPHNTLIAFWLYTGIFGLWLSLIMLTRIFYLFIVASRQNKQKMLPFLGALIAISIHGCIDTAYFRQDLATLCCVMLAALLIFADTSKQRDYSQLT